MELVVISTIVLQFKSNQRKRHRLAPQGQSGVFLQKGKSRREIDQSRAGKCSSKAQSATGQTRRADFARDAKATENVFYPSKKAPGMTSRGFSLRSV